MARMTPEEFVAWIGPTAQEVCRRYGIPASVCIAQAAIESTWGEDAIWEWNLFGRKAIEGDNFTNLWTQEYEGPNAYTEDEEHIYIGGNVWRIKAAFKIYDNLAEAIEDYCILLTEEPVYRPVMEALGNLQAYVYALAGDGENPGIYATNAQYGPDILATIEANNLAEYDVKEEQ